MRESLARFALTNSSLSQQALLARFRRRELLRIYLHDIRRTHSIVETTESLSNLADAILDYALSLARQDLDNRFGFPRRMDQRGRTGTAEFCIVALGKLGSYELNYASDIDLVFLYSDEGTTSGTGERGAVTNREYFVKLAEAVVKLAGQSAGEGAAYRVDLRLRPHGRDGALASSLDEATRYYHQTAQAWERQTLIRSRAAAGSASLFSQFAAAVKPQVFRIDVSVKDALDSVRLAKQKIDKHIERRGGFNVKLSPGGIREIEFIAQALQLAHGGKDEWLRVSHTLVSLGRLADRGFITEQERTELSSAYTFLRSLEHRLQMEHGLQTHLLPDSESQRSLVARRMGYFGENALDEFHATLRLHTENVLRAYKRVFEEPLFPREEAKPASMRADAGWAADCSPRRRKCFSVAHTGRESTGHRYSCAFTAWRGARILERSPLLVACEPNRLFFGEVVHSRRIPRREFTLINADLRVVGVLWRNDCLESNTNPLAGPQDSRIPTPRVPSNLTCRDRAREKFFR